ncbi:MAG: GTP-binding protein [Solirubrobacterales bacterium]|nr:GTP-binding protein [Solirubrobacterales bacterium]
MTELRPLIVLSGFLGSGKTTLLRRALHSPAAAGTAVLVNEIGEIGLDQHRFTQLAERTVLLDSGCLCCSSRADVVDALRELVELEEAGRGPRVRRVVLETSGLADPRPVIATLERDPLLAHRFTAGSVIVTCDAEHAAAHAALPEWQSQVAAAHVVAITKADRADPKTAHALVQRRNPAAQLIDAVEVDLCAAPLRASAAPIGGQAYDHHHATGVSTAHAVVERPIDPALMYVWLSALLHAHGAALLRVKALLDTGSEEEGPLVLDAVQHTVYPPQHLDRWEHPRRSSMVVIARGLDARKVTDAFRCQTVPA